VISHAARASTLQIFVELTLAIALCQIRRNTRKKRKKKGSDSSYSEAANRRRMGISQPSARSKRRAFLWLTLAGKSKRFRQLRPPPPPNPATIGLMRGQAQPGRCASISAEQFVAILAYDDAAQAARQQRQRAHRVIATHAGKPCKHWVSRHYTYCLLSDMIFGEDEMRQAKEKQKLRKDGQPRQKPGPKPKLNALGTKRLADPRPGRSRGPSAQCRRFQQLARPRCNTHG